MSASIFDVSSTIASSESPTSPPRRLLHQRTYEIDSIVEDDRHFRLIGFVRDTSPDGLWAIDDDERLLIHHMQLELVIDAQSLQITDVSLQMHVRPHTECSNIIPAYDQLVGLSIARGFTHKVRELFGGPRACTHIGALLNAMAPVAIQSLWPFFRDQQPADQAAHPPTPQQFERNRDTCHVWASEGPMFTRIAEGDSVPVPLWAQDRLEQKGIPVEIWRKPPGEAKRAPTPTT